MLSKLKNYLFIGLCGLLISCQKSPIVIQVGTWSMSQDQLKALLKISPALRKEFNGGETERRQLVDNIVDEQVMIQSAYKAGLDKQLDSGLAGSEKEQKLFGLMLHKIVSEISPVTDKDALAYYEKHVNEYKSSAQVLASALVFKRKENAVKLLKELNKGRSINNLAKTMSGDFTMTANHGVLPIINKDRPTSEIEKVAIKLPIHHYSAITKMGDNYYILRKDKDIPAQTKSFKTAKPSIFILLQREKIRRWTENAKTSMNPVIRWDIIDALGIPS